MICDLDLPLSLWVEAVGTAIYIQNRIPHVVLGEKTPKEVFSCKKLAVVHTRIFGTLVYIHVPKEKRTKLEPFTKKGTFVGYNESSKSDRIHCSWSKIH